MRAATIERTTETGAREEIRDRGAEEVSRDRFENDATGAGSRAAQERRGS